jgi:hypothetical protein
MSYPNSPFLLKGALIYFGAPMLIPVPNIIVFQYNPETMTRSLTPWQPPAKRVVPVVPEVDTSGNLKNESELKAYNETLAKLSQPYDPTETFSLVLELDATDALEHPETHPVAVATGVADRLAAIEMLLYPPGDRLGVVLRGRPQRGGQRRRGSGAAQTQGRPHRAVLLGPGPHRAGAHHLALD